MNTLLKSPGGKARIADWIIDHFPINYKVYCEPFFGSGAVYFHLAPIPFETINDISGDVVNLFRVCRDFPDELARVIALTPFSREEYMNCYEQTEEPIERARRTLVRFHQSFATAARSKNSWRNVQTSSGPCVTKAWNALPVIIGEVACRLKNTQIENIDALELIRRYDSPDTLLYLDPPYPLSIREKNMYRHEMTDEQHIELLELVKKSKSKIILSSYDNELYNTALQGWETDTKSTIAQFGLQRTEKLYMNFQPPLLALSMK